MRKSNDRALLLQEGSGLQGVTLEPERGSSESSFRVLL